MIRLKKHTLFSLLLVIVGFTLMVYMIVYEDEPGAIPLIMIVGGFVWYFIIRGRNRSDREKQLS